MSSSSLPQLPRKTNQKRQRPTAWRNPDSATMHTARSAEAYSGVDRRTITRHVRPDAWLQSGVSDREWPLWSSATLDTFLAEREA